MIHFTKMHGAGNDYIYVNGFTQSIPDPARFARQVSHRHYGVGSDGLILILPSDRADFRMRMFNADGSEGRMCGNGVRCIAKYVYDYGLTQNTTITLETLAGIKTLEMTLGADGRVALVRVDMGSAILDPAEIPVVSPLDRFINQPIQVGGEIFRATCVSMGNPHAVVLVEDPAAFDLPYWGPLFERHPLFPQQVNTEFIRIDSPQSITMRVWERGSGETLACGTGACATVVAAALLGLCPRDRDVTVHLLGGDLIIRYREDGRVLMTGPAATIFDGTIDPETLVTPIE